MITQVRLRNFRSIGDVTVNLGPITLLVGRNGAGKSTFLAALQVVRDLLYAGVAPTLDRGMPSIARWVSGTSVTDVSIGISLEGPLFQAEYDITLGEDEQRPAILRESCTIAGVDSTVSDKFRVEKGVIVEFPRAVEDNKGFHNLHGFGPFLRLVGAMGRESQFPAIVAAIMDLSVYSIRSNELRGPQNSTSELYLTEHGGNMASVLLRLREGPGFAPLLARLQQVVEDLDDVSVEETGRYLITSLKHSGVGGRGPTFELEWESEGTLRLLGILTALYQEPRPSLIGIEEPELHIHPGALGVLVDALRDAALRSQILVTTQSPDLISRFLAEEIRVVERVGGVTQIGPIAEHQREALNQQLFSAGDLLRIEGLAREPVKVGGDA